MSDIIAITSAIGSLKAAFDLSKGILSVRDTALIQGKVIELQAQILSAQSEVSDVRDEHTAILRQVDSLNKEISDLKAWGADKARYELCKLPAGPFAYALKEDAAAGEPPHFICASCYQSGHKSILQPVSHLVGRSTSLDCPRCGTRIYETGVSHPGHTPSIKSR